MLRRFLAWLGAWPSSEPEATSVVRPTRQDPARPDASRRRVGVTWKNYREGDQYVATMTYIDQDGVITDRKVKVLGEGRKRIKSGEMQHYLKAADLDDRSIKKTFRRDRVLLITRVDDP